VFYDILQHRSCDKIYQGLHTQHFVMKLLYLHPYHTPTTTPPPTHISSLHHPYHHTFTHTHHTPITQIHILTTPIHIPTIPTHTHSTTHPYRLCPYPTTHTHIQHTSSPHMPKSQHTHSHKSSPEWCFPALQGPHHPTPPPAPHLSHPPHHCPVNAST